MLEQAFLPKRVRCEYNQQGLFCAHALTTRLFSRRRGSIRVVCVYFDQATSLFQLSRTPRTCFALDQATDDLSCARDTRRSDQRKSRTAGGKRAVATTTDHLASTDQTTCLPEERPIPPGTSRQNGADLETDPLPCPAGDAAAASIGSSSACSGNTN